MPWSSTSLLVAALVAAAPALPRVSHLGGTGQATAPGVRTAGGRAEIVLAGALVHVDASTAIRFDGATALTVDDGRVLVRTPETDGLDVAVPYARVKLAPAGVYSLIVDRRRERLLLRVIAGEALLTTEYGSSTRVAARQIAMMTSATSVPWASAYQPVAWDAFEVWSDARIAAAGWGTGILYREAGSARECSTWYAATNPCWWVPGYGVPVPPPGGPPLPPSYAPSYTPNYAPNYTPNFTVKPATPPPAPPPPAARPGPAPTPPPYPPPAPPPPPPARAYPKAWRVPSDPGPR